MDSTQRHNELLADFRLKTEHSKRLRQQSVMQHRANADVQATKLAEESLRKEKRRSLHVARIDHDRAFVEAEVVQGIEAVEANLRRLGLDNASAHRAPRASSKIQSAKERSRPSIIQGSTMGGGVVAFLRRTGEQSGVSDTSLYAVNEPSLSQGKQKLTAPKVLYPTMRPNDHESDDDTAPQAHDVNYESLNDEYVSKIRGRKEDDVRALRERDVRRHRMNGEQSRSKNQVLEQKELEKLLLRAKLINAPDRQRVIDKRVEGIQKGREKKLRAELIGRRQEAASVTVEAQLQHHLHETVEQRSTELADFAVLRSQGRQKEDYIRREKLVDKEIFCRSLVHGIVGIVGEMIDRSTSQLQDGSQQYNRATLGVSEWRGMVTRHLQPQAVDQRAPPSAVESTSATPTIQSTVQSFREVAAPEAVVDVSQLVQADMDYFSRIERVADGVGGYPEECRAVFVGGDPIISGVDLLTQNGDVTFVSGEQRGHLLLTPKLVQHLEFQAAKRSLDESLRDVDDALVQVSSELQTKQSLLASQTPMVKGKRDTKTKDTSPLAQTVMLLTSSHLELTQKQTAIRSEETKLRLQAATQTTSDSEFGRMVGCILSTHGTDPSDLPCGEDGNQIPLSLAHLRSNPDLANAILIFAGFPLSVEFGESLKESVSDVSSLAYCELSCDAVSAVRRLDGVQEFVKYPHPPAAPVDTEVVQSKKKGVKMAPPTPAIVAPTEDPKTVLAHPLLSPLVINRQNMAASVVPAPPSPGRASPTIRSSSSVSIVVPPSVCPDINDLEYATSPFLLPADGDRSTARSKFTKFLRWFTGKEPNQFHWLLDFSHNLLSSEGLSRKQAVVSSLGDVRCFDATVSDSTLNLLDLPIIKNTIPGQAAAVPDEDDTVYFSELVIATSKLCASIVSASQTAVPAVNSTPHSNPHDSSTLEESIFAYRSGLATGLQAVEKCLVDSSRYLSSLSKCFAVSIFSASPQGESLHTEEGLALARWKQCDVQRRMDAAVTNQILLELDTAIANVLERIGEAESNMATAGWDVANYWEHGVSMLSMLQSQCRYAIQEWCLHLFTLHCEVIHGDGGFFVASADYRPQTPAELLSILSLADNSVQSQRSLNFKPDVKTQRPTPFQMKMALWVFSLEGRVRGYVTPEHFERCSSLLALTAASAPSLIPSAFHKLPRGRLFDGEVPVGWLLLTMAMGSNPELPTAFQAIKFAATLQLSSNSEFFELPWWGVDAGVVDNLLALKLEMEPGQFEPFLIAFLAADQQSQHRLNSLRRWFAVIGSYETSNPSEAGSLSKESLCRHFPKGSWRRVELDLLKYLTGDASNCITFEALSSTPLGELLVAQADMSFD